MKTWIVISALIGAQFIIIGYGLPFSINAGAVQVSSHTITYVTTSRTLASFILSSEKSEISCDKAPSVCVQVSNPEGIGPYMPIQFETCHPSDAQMMAQCHRPHLQLGLSTAVWIQTSLGRRL